VGLNLYTAAFNYTSILSEIVTVIRQTEQMQVNGRHQIVPVTYQVRAVVVASTPDNLDRDENFTVMPRTIELDTNFALQGPGQGLQPDEVIWHGTTFIVSHVKDYSKLGYGYINATAESRMKQDPATMLP
jgi:hypothetical protein